MPAYLECIEKKIIEEDLKHCPLCNAYWGCYPLNNLKPDTILQGVIEKCFPSEGKSAEAPKNVPSATLPENLQEDSPSSLKANARNAKIEAEKVQDSSKAESSKKLVPNKKTSKGNAELCKGKADMHMPLVEAARKMKLSDNESTKKKTDVIPMLVDSGDNDSQVPKVQVKKPSQTGGKKESKLKGLQGTKERKVNFDMDLNLPATTPVIGSSSKSNNKWENLPSQYEIGSSSTASNYVSGSPVWLSLVPSESKEIGARLPKISSPFLRVKDGNATVSIIEKYVIKSLDLPSDAKVEISLWGQPVYSWWKLQNLVEIWKLTMPKNERFLAPEGSSAEEFVIDCMFHLGTLENCYVSFNLLASSAISFLSGFWSSTSPSLDHIDDSKQHVLFFRMIHLDLVGSTEMKQLIDLGMLVCRECIEQKIADENLRYCPVCNTDWGCLPLDKLKADHRLQGLRDRIFPSKEKNAKAPESVPSVTLQDKSTEGTLSSLKANAKKAKAAAKKVATPTVSDISTSKPDIVVKKDEKRGGIEILDEVSTILSARRAKIAARKKFIRRESTPPCQPDKATGDEKEDAGHSRLQTSNGTYNTRVQNPSKPESDKLIGPNKTSVINDELWKELVEMTQPLTNLVEAARKNKSSNKSPMKEIAVIPMPVDSSDNDSQMPKVQPKKDTHTDDKKESNSTELKRLQGTKERTVKFTGDLNLPAASPMIGSTSESNNKFGNLPAQPVIGSSSASLGPIWFSLIASEDKEVGARLPQISSHFIRVRDGSLPVSHIEKYVVKKLGLPSDAEVEISLWGQPVLSSWKLQNLVEMWLQTVPKNEKIHTSVGSSAKDFVMVLSYGLKA
ncbi:hypothetical protein RIF29_21615 [Crotalaria pallida]|uniref:Uncharacterized protein n=1 Tax=Crotalaria pallida TaxID=3830 RepID=A0AAN9F6Z8_CROPI